MEVDPRISASLRRFDEEEIPSVPPERLPLLDELRARFREGAPFAGMDALFIQHHLGPLVPKLAAMVEGGLDPSRCWLVDIPYSTADAVRGHLHRMGFLPEQATNAFTDPLEDYCTAQGTRVALLLQKLAARPHPRPLLVLDDGAYFLRFLRSVSTHRPELLPRFLPACVVEQTTRGHRFLEGPGAPLLSALRLPAISIARSKTKLEVEAPFIGAAVSRALARSVGPSRLASLHSIAVIGFGAVGKATSTALLAKAPRATIDVIDVSAEARDEAARLDQRCRAATRLPEDARYELVVGCTGSGSFRLEQRRLLADGALLASGSSAAVEFNRTGFIELADQLAFDEIEVVGREEAHREGIHATLTLRHEEGRTFSFLNAGFPINFDGRLECLPTRMIQPTHCLLYAAACQVLRERRPGLGALGEVVDGWIRNRALELL